MINQRNEQMETVAFIVNGSPSGAMGQRAKAFADLLANRYDIRIAYRTAQKLASIYQLFAFLRETKPTVSYVFDMSFSGVLAAGFYKLLFRNRLIIDTGDAIYELAREAGERGKLGLGLTWLLEWFSLKIADHIVVRGTFHKQLLTERAVAVDVIQDGVDTKQFAPEDVSALRRQLGLEDVLTIGLIGSSVWSEKQQLCYGWDLVETIRLLKDKPVMGLMIGDGSGIAHLKARCRKYGIEDRLQFRGFVPYEDLPKLMGVLDVCLSTQTNNIVGKVRTTGKLPLYLAMGKFVLASNVGEASLVLPPEMLVPYEGIKDEIYPCRLAERILTLLASPDMLARADEIRAIGKQHFEYSSLAEKLAVVIDQVSQKANAIGQTSQSQVSETISS
ncbi:MAG TPA: hypothetical protein VFZ34_18245 [Blastocatellia bacterium]|nr:hypothetical protein [Blastocatellia bacterium]